MISIIKLGPQKQAHSKLAIKASTQQATCKLGGKHQARCVKFFVSSASRVSCAGYMAPELCLNATESGDDRILYSQSVDVYRP